MRFPVVRLLGLLAAGETREAILQSYPYLEPEDIDEALCYAASLAEDETVDPPSLNLPSLNGPCENFVRIVNGQLYGSTNLLLESFRK